MTHHMQIRCEICGSQTAVPSIRMSTRMSNELSGRLRTSSGCDVFHVERPAVRRARTTYGSTNWHANLGRGLVPATTSGDLAGLIPINTKNPFARGHRYL